MRALLYASFLFATPAAANPSVTLPQGTVNATVTTEINASNDVMGSPSSVAPDLSIGATDDLTLSVVHSTFGTTGFRGGAGLGFCVAESCTYAYNNAGLEATHALSRGRIAAGLTGGFYATHIHSRWFSAKVGGKVRVALGDVTLSSNPSVFLALTKRDGADMNRHRLFLPVAAMVRIARPLSAGVSTGFKAALDDVSGSYEVAAGALAQYTISPAWTAGASWVHGKIVGGDMALPGDASGLDYRAVQVWLSLTR